MTLINITDPQKIIKCVVTVEQYPDETVLLESMTLKF
jgi:hypothetical protein